MKEASLILEMGGTVGLMENAVIYRWGRGGENVRGIRGLAGKGWDVESLHILADSF